MNQLLEALFQPCNPLRIGDLVGQIVKEISDDPDTWRGELSAALVLANQKLEEAYETSLNLKRQAWATLMAKQEGAQISDLELLQAKAAAFDAHEEWVTWITIEGDLRDLAVAMAKPQQAPREYLQ